MYSSGSCVWQKKPESRINDMKVKALKGVYGIRLKDRVKNNVIRENCGLKEDVVTKIK